MQIRSEVMVCAQFLSELEPQWETKVARRLLTTDETSTRHLLAQVFGTFKEGVERITRHSGLTLQELGLRPYPPSTNNSGEALTLLRDWHTLLCNVQQNRSVA